MTADHSSSWAVGLCCAGLRPFPRAAAPHYLRLYESTRGGPFTSFVHPIHPIHPSHPPRSSILFHLISTTRPLSRSSYSITNHQVVRSFGVTERLDSNMQPNHYDLGHVPFSPVDMRDPSRMTRDPYHGPRDHAGQSRPQGGRWPMRSEGKNDERRSDILCRFAPACCGQRAPTSTNTW